MRRSSINEVSWLLLMSTPTFMLLDMTNFLAPGCSYAQFLLAFQVSEYKGFFPPQCFDSINKLQQSHLLPFYSSQKGVNTLEADYLSWENNRHPPPPPSGAGTILEVTRIMGGTTVPFTQKFIENRACFFFRLAWLGPAFLIR